VKLFDLDKVISEKTNLQDKHADVVERLTKQLEKLVADGRSTPGQPQKNTGAVNIRKK
jgi:arylsulfatase A